MTTICYLNGELAADSQVTEETESGGSRKFTGHRKLMRGQHGKKAFVMAASGDSYGAQQVMEWYLSRKSKKPKIKGDCEVLVLFRDDLFVLNNKLQKMSVPMGTIYAVGSGSKAALGAYFFAQKAGVSICARQCVEAACMVDPYSGGDIFVEAP